MLSRAQRKALKVAIAFEKEADVWTEVKDISQKCGFTLRKSQGICESLAADGRIRWGDKQHTAFKLNETGRAYAEIERKIILSHIAAFIAGAAFGLLMDYIRIKIGL